MMVPTLMDPAERDHFNYIYSICNTLSVQCADKICSLVRSMDTNLAYNTQGGVSATGELVDIEMRWIACEEYMRKLEHIGHRFNASMDDVRMCDMSMRVKR
jgi:hypothetical protein